MTDDFFSPESDYQVPASASKYTKLEQGETRIRLIGEYIKGSVGWINETQKDGTLSPKPLRCKDEEAEATYAEVNLKDPVRHFWAMTIWNYNTSAVEILEITQKTVMTAIMGLNKSVDWGHPTGYDMVITKTVVGDRTTYGVQGGRKSLLEAEEVRAAFHAKPLSIRKLYTNEDPWALSDIEKPAAVEVFEKIFNDLPF